MIPPDAEDVPGSSTTVRQPTTVEEASTSSTPFVVSLVIDCPGSLSILEKPVSVEGVLGLPSLAPGASPSHPLMLTYFMIRQVVNLLGTQTLIFFEDYSKCAYMYACFNLSRLF